MPKDGIGTENYLSEAVSGKYYSIIDKHKLKKRAREDLIKENRLSQIFSATFNNSVQFQNKFFDFIDYHKKSKVKPFAVTQDKQSIRNKIFYIDIIIYNINKKTKEPLITIENKVGSKLYKTQLINYNKIEELENTTKLAIAKHVYDRYKYINIGWEIFRWSDFHNFLFTKVFSGIDDFLIKNFLHYLEVNQLAIEHEIKKNELDDLTLAMHQLRNQDKAPTYHNIYTEPSFYMTIKKYIDMLYEIFNEAKINTTISKRINFRQFRPFIGYYESKSNEDRDDLWVGMEFTLKIRVKRNDVKYIGTGITFLQGEVPSYEIITYAVKTDYYAGPGRLKSKYRNNDLIYEKYSKQVIRNWSKWLKNS